MLEWMRFKVVEDKWVKEKKGRARRLVLIGTDENRFNGLICFLGVSVCFPVNFTKGESLGIQVSDVVRIWQGGWTKMFRLKAEQVIREGTRPKQRFTLTELNGEGYNASAGEAR
jgi:hypothetical protein